MTRYEKYPSKEKRASGREAQIAWSIREVGWAQEKFARMNPATTDYGYAKKQKILSHLPNSGEPSTHSMIGSYWHRSPFADIAQPHLGAPNENAAQLFATRSVQYFGKVTSGIIDKIVLIDWLQSPTDDLFSIENSTEVAIQAAFDRANELGTTYSGEELLVIALSDWSQSKVGQGIFDLQTTYAQDPTAFDQMRRILIDTSAVSILVWQRFAVELESLGYDTTLPMPGEDGSGGTITPWAD